MSKDFLSYSSTVSQTLCPFLCHHFLLYNLTFSFPSLSYMFLYSPFNVYIPIFPLTYFISLSYLILLSSLLPTHLTVQFVWLSTTVRPLQPQPQGLGLAFLTLQKTEGKKKKKGKKCWLKHSKDFSQKSGDVSGVNWNRNWAVETSVTIAFRLGTITWSLKQQNKI